MFVSIYRNAFIVVVLSALIVSGLGLYECYREQPVRTLYPFVGTPIIPPAPSTDQSTDVPTTRLLSPVHSVGVVQHLLIFICPSRAPR
jgi:hypothetical protein